jgi:putative inorganic carbon (HCO3(-)) transporter
MDNAAILEVKRTTRFHPLGLIYFFILESLLVLCLLVFGWKVSILLTLFGISCWLVLTNDLGFIYFLIFISPIEVLLGTTYETSRLLKWSLAILFGFIVSGKILISTKRFTFPANTVTRFMLLFIGWGIITSFFSIDQSASLIRVFRDISVLMLFLLIYHQLTDERDVRKVITAWMTVALLISIFGILQYFVLGRGRIASFYLNPNALGIFYFLIIPVVFSLSLYETNRSIKRRYHILLIILALALFLTGSRASWLATLVGVVTLVILTKRRRLYFAILFFVLMVVIGLIFSGVFRAALENTIRWSRGLTFRNFIWLSGLNLIKAHPFWGVGPAATPKILEQYSAISNPSIRILLHSLLETGHLHNLFLQVAAETGIPGLLILLWFFVALFTKMRALIRKEKNKFRQALLGGGLAIIPAAIVHGFFEKSIMSSSSSSVYFWILFGLIYSMLKSGSTECFERG